MIKTGRVTLAYWVCREGTDVWRKIDEVPKLKSVFNADASPRVSKPDKKIRHGFTTFWLWLGLLGYGLALIGLGIFYLVEIGFAFSLITFGIISFLLVLY